MSALWDRSRKGEDVVMLPAHRLPHSLSHCNAETVGECCCCNTQEMQTAAEDRNFTFRSLKYVYRELRQADPSLISRHFKSPKHVLA